MADDARLARLETLLGHLLLAGVSISACALVVGVVSYLIAPDARLSTVALAAGLAALTATPMVRVLVSLVEYFRMKEYAFAVVTLVVLTELGIGVAYALWKG